jgi:hypothetical protein
MPVYCDENPHKCCTFIPIEKDYTELKDSVRNEIKEILNGFTQKLRGTEHNNCSVCEYAKTYKLTGQCIKPNMEKDYLENVLKGD